ncbi:hypothetical protein ONZ45_g16817 [Pleurotus djamor]|nr:hypothetical protein ONZ45_g16817 [Pleurotus djamor]
MPLVNPESPQSLLDVQIKEHELILLALKRKRNSLSYISQLPDEILSQIFVIRRGDSLQSLSVPSSSSDPFKRAGWVAISCVCQHWRQVSLRLPYLWSYINFNRAGFHGTNILLERSKPHPLYIKAHVVERQQDLQNLFADIIATRALRRLEFSTDMPTSEVANLLARRGNSAPFLQFLSLKGTKYTRDSKEATSYLWDDMPMLGVLSICTLQPPSKFPLLSHLTTLTVDTHRSAQPLTVMCILEILQQTPHIEVVSLALIYDKEPPTIHYPRVNLPDLRSLELKFPTIGHSIVLDYLSFPATACASLWFSQEPDHKVPHDISPIHRLWDHLAHTEQLRQSPTKITTSNAPQYHTSIRLFDPGSPSMKIPKLAININGTMYEGSFFPLIARTSTLTLDNVINTYWWNRLTPYVKNVEVLTVADYRGFFFLSRLRPPADSEKELPFPRLKTLVFRDYQLTTKCQDNWVEYRKVSAFLRLRHIETIKFVGGAASKLARDHFAKRKINVEWDNVECVSSIDRESDGEDRDEDLIALEEDDSEYED